MDEVKGIVDIVLDFDTLLKRYKMVKADQDGDIVTVMLEPKSTTALKTVEVRFSVKEAYITFLKMSFGANWQSHDFTNPSRAALPPGTFALPKDLKVQKSN
jgi:hypothetical protein